MTPKEKALKIVNEFHKLTPTKNTLEEMVADQKLAKESALLAVNLILQPFLVDYQIREHWIKVRKEINNL